jgi:putative spermidine/putrescine transport system permease protein
MTFVIGLGLFVTPLVLGGGFVVTMAVFIYNEVINTFDYAFGSATTIILVALTLVFTFLINTLISKITKRH